MDAFWHHALLALAVGAVGAGGWRIASLAVPRGLERLLAAITCAVAAIVVQVLALGLVGLSRHAVLLALVALAVYGVVRVLTPAPLLGAREEIGLAWRAAGRPQRAVAGALLGLLAGWIAWQLEHPYVLYDGEIYHLPLAATWAQTGHTASLVDLLEGVPVANYPITNEVATSWVIGLSKSWIVASVWSPLAAAVLGLAGWSALRRLRVPRGIAGTAVAAILLMPIVGGLLGGPLTDVPTSAWLVTCGALCLAAREHPRLLAIALVAAGLSFGTKTTGALLLALMLGAALWRGREHWRAIRGPLALGLGVAIVVGGIWSLRNLVDHGSPLWPFVAGPFGDAIPPAFRDLDGSFLSERAWEGNTAEYVDLLSGGVVLLIGALLAPLVARTKAVLIASGIAVLALLTWANAPYTGITSSAQLAVGAVRYMLPALIACALALALAARDGGTAGRRLVGAVLGLAAFLSFGRTFVGLGFPQVPDTSTAVAAAAVGAIAVFGVARVPRLAAAVAVVGAVAGLSAAASGYVKRETEAGGIDQPLLGIAFRDREWNDGDFPIHMGPVTAALLAGDRLQHRVKLLPSRRCDDVYSGWVIVVTVVKSPEAERLKRCFKDSLVLERHNNFTIYAP
ncbi:MAG TPA: hypothetical protein VFZ89_11870 [Solirubrobacteraceae bacterium]